jgi:hypothetical protein
MSDEKVYKTLVEKSEGKRRDHFEDQRVDGRIILKWTLKK